MRNFKRFEVFQATEAPLLVVDTDLVIRDVNNAYLEATDRSRNDIIGLQMFTAFPDNPEDPEASGVTNLNASFETVFRTAKRHHMPVQRYDIPSGSPVGTFIKKYWTPVNSPLKDESGRVIGALHHVQDITMVIEQIVTSSPPSATCFDQNAWSTLATAFVHEVLAHEQARKTAAQLKEALSSRIIIEQAKGMISVREEIDVEEAFNRLREHSRRNNAHIHDIAREVVENGISV